MKISSVNNPHIKYLKRLQTNGSFRRREKKFLAEGAAAIKTSLENNKKPLMIYLCPEMPTDISVLSGYIGKKAVPVTELSKKCFEKISDVKAPQGVAGLFPFARFLPDEFFRQKRGVYLCCHEFQDPGNLGTLIRTADALGASGVVTTIPSVSFYNPKVVRSSAGSVLNIPLLELPLKEFIIHAKKARLSLYTAMPRKGEPLQRIHFKRPLCIIIGSEAHGIPASLLNMTKPVSIPMRKGVESLNAAISGALMLYQAKQAK